MLSNYAFIFSLHIGRGFEG